MAEREVFTIKHFNSIVAGMLNLAIGDAAIRNPAKQVLTDFFIGSVSRTMLEAVAIEIDQLYFRTFLGIRDAIPVAIYTAFDFDKLPATSASGNELFTKTPGATGIITIPKGTLVQTATGIIFETIAVATLDADAVDDVLVPIVAQNPGELGNVEANSITFKKTAVNGIDAVTNPQITSGGSDEESEEDRKVRFQDFISNLTRATRRACEVGALTATITDEQDEIIEKVTHARVYEPFNVTDNTVANGAAGDPENFDVGFFEIWVDNGSGNASTNLIEDEALSDQGSGQFIGATAGALSTIPVAKFSVNITFSPSGGTAKDDGDGNITGDIDALGNNVIDYTTGQIDVTSIAGGDTGAIVTYNGGDEGLVQVAQRIIDGFDDDGNLVPGWKGAGVEVDVRPITPVVQNVVTTIEMKPGFQFNQEVIDDVDTAISQYFDGLNILAKISWENLITRITNANPGIFETTLVTPPGDIAIAYFERAILGSTTITQTV